MRICVFAEGLAPPLDEGIKNQVWRLIQELGAAHTVYALTTRGRDMPELGIADVRANRMLLGVGLARQLRHFRPDVILYVPSACGTLFSFMRSRALRWMARGAPVALLSLQPRRYGALVRKLMPLVQPELVLVQSPSTRASLAPLAGRIRQVAPGVDVERFRPATPDQRIVLRQRFGFARQEYVALHVGHLKRERNVQALIALQQTGVRVVLAASTSTWRDNDLVVELRAAGVTLIEEYLPDIAALYSACDCYVFPARAHAACIDVPLSVLEAMACNLPIVTTRFGGLPALFEHSNGLRFVKDDEQLVSEVQACRRLAADPGTRAMVLPYAWSRVAEEIATVLAQELCPHGARDPR